MTIIQFKARQRKAQKKVTRCVDGINTIQKNKSSFYAGQSRKKLKEVIKRPLENGWQ